MIESKGKVLLLGSEGCGSGDASLGYKVMAVFLEALSKREDRPKVIVCWNTAVKLMAQGSPVLAHLRRLEQKGVEIVAGKLCVEQLGLTGKIVVGKVVGLNDVLDIILNSDCVSI
jgi:hypothetical protein